jgi:hypothetical protein
MSPLEYVRVRPDVLAALDYPGTPAPGSGVLDGDRFWLGREVDRLDDRTMVLAVGANAAPSVLAAKLLRAGVAGGVGMVRAEVAGLGVGHSAHVSRSGYVPAGPYAAQGASSVVGLWVTPEQLAAIDATEPNYDRIGLRRAVHSLRLELGRPPPTYDVYVSRWGVLAADGVPLRLGTQGELFARLARDPALAGVAPWDDAEAAVRALADPAARARMGEAFVAAGWVADAALGSADQAVDPIDRQP